MVLAVTDFNGEGDVYILYAYLNRYSVLQHAVHTGQNFVIGTLPHFLCQGTQRFGTTISSTSVFNTVRTDNTSATASVSFKYPGTSTEELRVVSLWSGDPCKIVDS